MIRIIAPAVQPRSVPEISNSPSRSSNAIFFENLDGLRFLCFLAVFLFHSFHTESSVLKSSSIYQWVKFDLFGNGNLGVNFFFVLSGFLITYLLIVEKEKLGKIDIGKFWMRRILRIWPLFYFCVFFGFVIFPQLKLSFGMIPNETADPIFYLTFLNNFDFIQKGGPDSSVLAVLWSIAIEEQFYLLWPVFLSFLPVRGYPLFFLATLTATFVFRASVIGSPERETLLELHTLSCIGDMTIGAMGAFVVLKNQFDLTIEKLPRWSIGGLYLVFISIFFFRDELFFHNDVLHVVERSFIAVVILGVILEQNYARRSFFKMCRWSWMSGLGKISYGLYCLHFIGILITTSLFRKLGWNTELWQVLILETAVALALTILLASLSYRYFEHPFLKIKDRFTRIGKTRYERVVIPTISEAPADQPTPVPARVLP